MPGVTQRYHAVIRNFRLTTCSHSSPGIHASASGQEYAIMLVSPKHKNTNYRIIKSKDHRMAWVGWGSGQAGLELNVEVRGLACSRGVGA